MKKREPRWLSVDDLLGFHGLAMANAGGLAGLRDRGLLESAIARAPNLWNHEEPDLFDLAAAYAYGIARNHPFIDGNKRAAFLVAFTFLVDNGIDPPEDPAAAAVMTVGLADKSISEAKYAQWLRENSKPA